MEILDDQHLEFNSEQELKTPLFLKRINLFSIISLIHAIALFALGILLFGFITITNEFGTPESIAIIILVSFLFILSFLLLRLYQNIKKYLNQGMELKYLYSGMNQFFYFWVNLIIGAIVLILFIALFIS